MLRPSRSPAKVLASLLAVGLAAGGAVVAGTAPSASAPSEPQRAAAFPPLRVTTQIGGLTQPWDVQQLPGGRYLISERESRRLLIRRAGVTRAISFPSSSVWSSGETGLMSIAVDPDFAKNRRIYTCQGGFTPTGHDVRVVRWVMNASYTGVKRSRFLLTGLPASSGRHGGCRLLIAKSGALYVGTGDSATTGVPRNLTSLGGKVLRLSRFSGKPWPTNPWPNAASVKRRYVLTYGHRNVQGLAERSNGTVWSVEHGSYRDDEVNLLTRGGDYGWNPGPGYDESVPMTDHALPGTQVSAKWRSGEPTIATSGAAWVRGTKWGSYNGMLAVAALKGSRLLFLRFDANGNLLSQRVGVTGFGRLRSVTRAANGDLLVTTANGSGDRVLRVSPQ